MISGSEILHEGKVQAHDADSVTVMLSPLVSCSGCHAEGSCNLAGNKHKMIKVQGSFDVRPGEKVTVSIRKSQGYSALFLGYVLPLIIVLLALITFISLSISELLSGLLSIAILVPYYLILLIFRKLINKKFSFSIKSTGLNEFYNTSYNNKS